MKKVTRILSAVLVLAMFFAMLPAVFAADGNEGKFVFLATSDVHGKIYATDYSQPQENSGTASNGLTRAATYIRQVEKEYGDENVILADLGDTFQGEPITNFYAMNHSKIPAELQADPAVKAFRNLHYDLYVIGNHEFNWGLPCLTRQLDEMTAPAEGNEQALAVCTANYLDAEHNSDTEKDWSTWRGYAPYVIKDFDGFKVAVIGFGTPEIPKWDIPSHWEGIYFADIIETYKHYEAEMKEKSDMIIVMAHEGAHGMQELVEATDSIDAVFSGHEHGTRVYTDAKNLNGKMIPILQPGEKAKHVANLTVTFNKESKEFTLDTQIKNVQNNVNPKKPEDYNEMPVDEELEALLKPYEDYLWTDYMMEKIGEATGDFPASGLCTAPSAFVDFVNTVQTWGAYDNTGKNTPDDKTDDTPAQLSICAPLIAGSGPNIIDKGDIYLGQLYKLYKYENWFYQIRMSGEEIHQWLEFSATKLKPDENGVYDVRGFQAMYFDVISGEGFHYVINVAKPEGSRIVEMTYNGKPVQADDEFTVVVNNYRYNGGGEFIEYLNNHGCDFKPNDPDRIIYSTQFDMIAGEDNGQARALIVEYIKNHGKIAPEITSDWKMINQAFDDVNEGDWFYDYVTEMYNKGVVNGATATGFLPQDSLTRGQVAVMLHRAMGSPDVEGLSKFTDVPKDSYYAKAITWAQLCGVVNGRTETTFEPEGNITREELVTIFYRVKDREESKTGFEDFQDGDKVENWAVPSFKWAIENKIIGGTSDDGGKTLYLNPQGFATRAEACKVFAAWMALELK